MRAAVALVLLALLASGCAREEAEDPFDAPNAATQIRAAMAKKRYISDLGGSLPCSEVFILEQAQPHDHMVDGAYAKVESRITVRALQDVPVGAQANDCYGVAPGGWTVDELSPGTYAANFERWARGWRIVSVPELR